MLLKCDVAVIGGGPAGCSAAITLARRGCRVRLIEGTKRQGPKAGEGLPPVAKTLLQKFGVMAEFESAGHIASYGIRSAWGSNHLRDTDFIGNPHGCGWQIDRPAFEAMLRNTAAKSGAHLQTGTRVIGRIHRVRGRWQLSLQSGCGTRSIEAGSLVDTTGRASVVARRHGVERRQDDRLLAFAAFFDRRPEAPPDLESLVAIESAANGWWYTARLPSSRRIAVYLTDADDRSVKAARNRLGFLELLDQTRHVRERLAAGNTTLSSGPCAMPANSSRLTRFAGEGWIAAGDAALSLDPLSSQGILTALYSGLHAGEAVCGQLCGDQHALLRYEELMSTVYDSYLGNRARFYGYERRWPENQFWERRRF